MKQHRIAILANVLHRIERCVARGEVARLAGHSRLWEEAGLSEATYHRYLRESPDLRRVASAVVIPKKRASPDEERPLEEVARTALEEGLRQDISKLRERIVIAEVAVAANVWDKLRAEERAKILEVAKNKFERQWAAFAAFGHLLMAEVRRLGGDPSQIPFPKIEDPDSTPPPAEPPSPPKVRGRREAIGLRLVK